MMLRLNVTVLTHALSAQVAIVSAVVVPEESVAGGGKALDFRRISPGTNGTSRSALVIKQNIDLSMAENAVYRLYTYA